MEQGYPGLTNPGTRVFNHYSIFLLRVRIESLGEDTPRNMVGAAGHRPLPPCAGIDSFCICADSAHVLGPSLSDATGWKPIALDAYTGAHPGTNLAFC